MIHSLIDKYMGNTLSKKHRREQEKEELNRMQNLQNQRNERYSAAAQ